MDDNVIPFPHGRRAPGPDDIRELAASLIEEAGGANAALSALQQWLAASDFLQDAGPSRPRPTLLPRRPQRVAYTVRVDLDDAHPPIWRRLRLASDVNLEQLHPLLQVAMGWSDSHLHHFQAGPDARDFRVQPFLTAYDIEEGEDDGVREVDVHLDEVMATPGHRLFYEYDFGDSWSHTLRLEKVEPWREGDPVAHCLDGRRACPPEDVGGLPGYEEVLAALAGKVDPDDPEWTRQQLEWLPDGFDPAAFDRDEVNGLLAADPLPDFTGWNDGLPSLLFRAGGSALSPVGRLLARATAERVRLTDEEAAAAAHRFWLLLRAVGPGLKLTAAGYLPPAVAVQLGHDLGVDDDLWRGGTREDQLGHVLGLRESATALGLVRKANGRLTVTAAGKKCAADARSLLSHVAGRLPLGRREAEKDAGLMALLSTAAGQRPRWDDEDFGALFGLIGWFAADGRQAAAAYYSAQPTLQVLDALVGDRTDHETTRKVANALLQR